jgi:uncharacterized membrane protein
MPPKLKKIKIEKWKRSLAKSVSYRLAIMALDFIVLYLFTRRTDIALGFVILSNIYTTIAYFIHERVWNRIGWGVG